ncbi:MAG: triose-phosphate isomerase [Candidatus Daviesbacteria bacterium]|nr:triose-phosphate isomerase [Candidatus Daviesbacteria bacterium]
MKNIWIIANWKSNKNISEALEWISIVGPKIPREDNSPAGRGGLKIVVCPTFSCLSEVKKAIQVGNFPIILGAQDLSPFGIGSYTGEEPAVNLKQLVSLSILGHSERRQNFSETDEMVAKKVMESKQNEIIPLVCVQSADTKVSADCQLIAYEPVFAIGTGNPDTPENANSVAGELKQKLAESVEVLYGGSVNSGNVASFTNQTNISGVLIGKASLDAEEFVKIVEACKD